MAVAHPPAGGQARHTAGIAEPLRLWQKLECLCERKNRLLNSRKPVYTGEHEHIINNLPCTHMFFVAMVYRECFIRKLPKQSVLDFGPLTNHSPLHFQVSRIVSNPSPQR